MPSEFIPPSAEKIAAAGYEAFVTPSTGSTNTDLLNRIKGGAETGVVLAAVEQTGGKGRLGRSFSSGYGGIYFSFDLTVRADVETARRLTPLAGVAAAGALCELYGLDVKLKWVNDIWYRGRKLGGILAETASVDGGDMRAVIGIGINGNNADIPETATSLEAAGVPLIDAGEIISRILDGFTSRLPRIGGDSVMDEYRALSAVVGHKVRVHTFDGGEDYDAFAIGIADDCSLTVQTDGGIRSLSSGEVSIRL